MSTLSFLLPAPPANWTPSKDSYKLFKAVSAPVEKVLEPAGKHFSAHASRKLHGRTISEDERTRREKVAARVAALRNVAVEEADEVEDPSLFTLDAQQWKTQDHYKVLGLSKLRHKSTLDDIQKAYNKKALKHHPDKKGGDDRFFKCIQMAFNVLSDSTKKRQFDSADPGVSDEFPSPKAKGDFFKLYAPYFVREGRFSNKQPVPELGDIDSIKKDVEAFYDFWYNFDSWRTFEYLDKHDTDLADNRDDKRYMDRKNKSERAQRKKDDNTRLRQFVDQALKLDPRIAKFRQEESKQRNAKKFAREAAEREAAEAKQKAEEEAKAAAAKAAEEEKANVDAAKKDKEAKKRAIKKEKKTIKKLMTDNNYFLAASAGPAGPNEVEDQLNKLDSVFQKLSVGQMETFRSQLEAANGDQDKLATVFDNEAKN